MNPWTSDIVVKVNPHTDWTHEITLSCTICSQLYRHVRTYPGLNAHEGMMSYFHTRRLSITEAVAFAIVEFGDYILGYEKRRLEHEAALDSCWRD